MSRDASLLHSHLLCWGVQGVAEGADGMGAQVLLGVEAVDRAGVVNTKAKIEPHRPHSPPLLACSKVGLH